MLLYYLYLAQPNSNNMKLKSLLFISSIFILFSGASVFGQQTDSEPKNMVKLNVLPLISGKFAFEYERMIKDRITVGGAVSFRPSKGLPFLSTVRDIVDNDDLNEFLDGFKSGNFSITPEARFYTSKRGPFRGFYVAPYLKYTNYSLRAPLNYDLELTAGGQTFKESGSIPVKGSLNAYTAGFSIGFNFRLTDNLNLDWRLIGPGYGFAKGSLGGQKKLTADEQEQIRKELDDIKDALSDLPVSVKMKYEVHGEGVDVKVSNSPWAGIRSGLSVGYRF
ncbi:uncharacterized protein DUF3575 [Sphingobacterium yanglingense]|uniref:Uncharacterized protein DUF3575 n=2 Tax=Sphingobacterium yanglingense TaxID=1437280 RepID=A0A4R6WN76_9SPHI|nr:uncharacterized protein DUF3575 [Sphingobacterium yanglingense]